MASSAPKPIWVRQAEEAKLKSDAETAAAAKAAFEATFNSTSNPESTLLLKAENSDSESDNDDTQPSIGPVDPNSCIVAGSGVAGGTSGNPISFTLTLKDSKGNKIPHGGAAVTAKIIPGPGVGGEEIEGMVKDSNDGAYTITYIVPKRGNYNVHLSVEDKPVTGSPFPVFFSTGTPPSTATPTTTIPVPMYGMINQTMPNMPNYMVGTGLGMMATGNTGGVILQGAGASLGEVCREYLHGKCAKVAGKCKFGHPPQALLMQVLATAATSMNGALMGPSAAAMAAAQAIVAAQALQAHAKQMQSQKTTDDGSGSPEKAAKEAETLKRTVQVSNLNPLLNADQLKQLFGYCGSVTDCTITDSKHFAYIEYTKPEEAKAALALNNIDVGGRPLNVEMAKSLPVKAAGVNNANLPTMMQQAVALQQMQFQQALAMQQAAATQQAAARAATMKSATEAAAARAREISMKLKTEAGILVGASEGGETAVEKEDKEENKKDSMSPSPSKRKSRSRSRSPIKYRSSRRRSRSNSYSPPIRRRRSRSPVRSSRYSSSYRDRRERDEYSRRERERRERDRRDIEKRESERRDRERRERDRRSERESERRDSGRRERESERGEREKRESEKSREHLSSSSRKERERKERERSRSRERKHEKYENDETKRGRDASDKDYLIEDEDDKINHKGSKPNKKEKVVEEERDSDSGEERETQDSKSYKRKSDRGEYDYHDKRHNYDKRKPDKQENVVDEERETLPSSDSKSRKRKSDRDEFDDDYDKRQHKRSHHRSEKPKEDYHNDKKNRDASKTVLDD